MDPAQSFGFNASDNASAYETYSARLALSAPPYKYVGSIGTYAEAAAAVDALTAEEKSRPVMLDLEFPWLAILWRMDSDGVPASPNRWDELYPAECAAEATRQGITLDGTTTLETWKTAAKAVNQDAQSYAKAQGCAYVVGYFYGTPPFSEGTGVPCGGLHYTPPASANSYFLANADYHPTLDEQSAERVAEGSIGDMGDAQANADACTASVYCNVCSGDRADDVLPDTAIAGVTRKTGTGDAASPDYTSDVLSHWVRATTSRLMQSAHAAQGAAVAAGSMSAANLGKPICPIIWGPEVRAFTGEFEEWNHWMGPTGKSITRWAEDEVAAFNAVPDSDAPAVRKPPKIFVFNDVRYYWLTIPTTYSSSDATYGWRVRRARWALEVALFGRPCPDTSHPVADETTLLGVTTQASQDAFFDNAYSFMSDSWWQTGASGSWWSSGGGSLIPSPCVLDSSSPLVTGGWITLSGFPKVRSTIITAIRHWLSDRTCQAAEAARAALA